MRWVTGLGIVVLACAPDAPQLEVTSASSVLRRGSDGLIRIAAEDRPGVPGRGRVRVESDVGSLVDGVTLTLDDLGVATARVSCQGATNGCAATSLTVTATWLRTPALTRTLTIGLADASANPTGASGDGGGDPTRTPRWSDVPSGFFLEGSPGGYVVQRRVFEPNGRVSLRQPPGELLLGLDPAPVDDVEEIVWSLEVAAPRGERLRVGRYVGAQRSAFRDGVAPGLSLSGEGRGCNAVGGFFEVHELTETPDGGISAFALSFEQWCEQRPLDWARGWVRLPPP
ncbi:MAG: hypothetical protein SFW67_09730 [Myxococcaceae bacterium]|nr:hypothetical protein [Myxococcaceae bacterium]